MLDTIPHTKKENRILEKGYIYASVASAFDRVFDKEKGKVKHLRNIREIMVDKGIATLAAAKIENHTLSSRDLDNEKLLEACEKYLMEKYPELRHSPNPENELLEGVYAKSTNRAINRLVVSKNLEEIEVDKLDDPDYVAKLEKKLSKVYPEIDFNEDPSIPLLEGEWAEKIKKAIDDLKA